MNCNYLRIKLDRNEHEIAHIPNMMNFCSKLVPYIKHYKKNVDFYNKTVKIF